jgi:alkylhydroperoxidase family enzyme
VSFIHTIAPVEAEGETAAMYRRQQAAWGYVPNYAKAFSHRPEVMARWGQLLAEIRRPMDKRRFELATFAAAHELRNSACVLAHGRALGEFFAEAEVLAIAEGRLAGVLDDAEQAIVRFARLVARDAAAIEAADVAALAAHGLDAGEIFDVAAAAAGRAFFTKVLDALGVRMDSPFLASSDAWRRALTVGRPIDERTPETMPAAATMPAPPPAARRAEGERHAA